MTKIDIVAALYFFSFLFLFRYVMFSYLFQKSRGGGCDVYLYVRNQLQYPVIQKFLKFSPQLLCKKKNTKPLI